MFANNNQVTIMINSLKFLLKSQIKTSIKTKKNRGFTVVELLIGLVLAVLIIAPMLTFVTGLLDTDNKEQAKTSTEQDLNASIDYINKELQQAFYIYGPVSTTDARPAIYAQLPFVVSNTATNGVGGCNASSVSGNSVTCTPIIAFWKKELMEKSIPIDSNANNNHDTFVDSLVVYYYITETKPTTWSTSGRIARFQIKDGVKNFSGTYINSADSTTSPVNRSYGFDGYDISGQGTTDDKMNLWTKSSETYNTPVTVLVDNIYSFSFTRNADNSATINITGNALSRLTSNPPTCTTDSIYCPTASLRLKSIGFINTTSIN
jgi:type II secretory pathway pseudopilin PulG